MPLNDPLKIQKIKSFALDGFFTFASVALGRDGGRRVDLLRETGRREQQPQQPEQRQQRNLPQVSSPHAAEQRVRKSGQCRRMPLGANTYPML